MVRIVAIAAMVAVLGAALAYFIHARNPPAPSLLPGAAATVNAGAPVPVTVSQATSRAARQTTDLVGTLRSDRQAAVTPTYPARILAVLVNEGDTVRQGQPVARLDVRQGQEQVTGASAGVAAAEAQHGKAVAGRRAQQVQMDAQVSQAEGGLRTALARLHQAQLAVKLNSSSAQSDTERAQAGVKAAEATLRQADTGLKQANATVDRLKYLYAHGGISRADLEGAEAQASIAQSQRDAASAGLDQARAAANPAAEAQPLRQQVSEADVAAAQAGVDEAKAGVRNAYRARAEALRIADQDIAAAAAQVRKARSGERQAQAAVGQGTLTSPIDGVATDVAVHAGEGVQAGMPLMTIVSNAAVYFEAAAPARYADLLRVGLPARVTLDTMPDHPFDGEVTELMPVSGAQGSSIPLRIHLELGSARLTPGVSGTAEVELSNETHAVTIPMDAVRNEGSTPYAYVVVNGKAQRRNLTLGGNQGQYVRVISGLKDGETVILTGPSTLQTGTPVAIVGG